MRTIATTLAAMLGVVLAALPVLAQGQVPAFCLATDPADPDYDITDYEPVRDADDWCKLAYHQPHKARRQLSKAVALVRSENNPNRYYWDPRIEPGADYIQLLRPWMAEQGWWLQWSRDVPPLSHALGIFPIRYFKADQRELPASERHPTFTLRLRLNRGHCGDCGRDAQRYQADFHGHYAERVPNGTGGWGYGRTAELNVQRRGEPNERWEQYKAGEYRVTIGDWIRGTQSSYPAAIFTAALHEALDCLAEPAMLEDWNFEGCEATIEVPTDY